MRLRMFLYSGSLHNKLLHENILLLEEFFFISDFQRLDRNVQWTSMFELTGAVTT